MEAREAWDKSQEVGIQSNEAVHLSPDEARRRDAVAGAALGRVLREHVEDRELLLGAPLPELACAAIKSELAWTLISTRTGALER